MLQPIRGSRAASPAWTRPIGGAGWAERGIALNRSDDFWLYQAGFGFAGSAGHAEDRPRRSQSRSRGSSGNGSTSQAARKPRGVLSHLPRPKLKDLPRPKLNGPEIEIGAAARAARVRFGRTPETEVRFETEPDGESRSETERENLPEPVEPSVTCRDVPGVLAGRRVDREPGQPRTAEALMWQRLRGPRRAPPHRTAISKGARSSCVGRDVRASFARSPGRLGTLIGRFRGL